MRIESGAEKSRGLFVFRFRVLAGFLLLFGEFSFLCYGTTTTTLTAHFP